MYRHTVTIYNEKGRLLKKLSDAVNLQSYGYDEFQGEIYRGGPVEAAFTADGKYLWVSNYSMIGEGFDHEGCDACIGDDFDDSFLYKINTTSFEIENVVRVGAVPKFIKISDDDQLLIVSNWTSSDVSIVDLTTETEVKRVKVGAHPRGVEITADNTMAYVTIMGSSKLAAINLENYEVSYINDIGAAPRHLLLAQSDSVLYISLNSANRIVKYNRYTQEKVSCKTPAGPRSMCIDPSEKFIYCVNYFDHSFSKINAEKMTLEATVTTSEKPIGVCGNWDESEIWVACYSGKLELFKDFQLDSLNGGDGWFGIDWSVFSLPKPQVAPHEIESDSTIFAEVDSMALPETKLEVVVQPKKNISAFPQPTSARFTRLSTESVDCHYYVVCGSFSILENAHKRVQELTDLGFSCEVIEGVKLNHVTTACAESRDNAQLQLIHFEKSSGFSAWILKR